MSIYYLPIDSINLSFYFHGACICPTKYINERQDDPQSFFENSLLLSKYQSINNSNCTIKIVLTPDEINNLEPIDNAEGCWLFNKPLPITRVEKILFNDSEQQNYTIKGIELNSAFVPSQIFDNEFINSKTNININQKDKSPSEKNWEKEIKDFDQLLGAIAMMRIVTKENMNFSENYFSFLSTLNELIENDLNKYNQEIKINPFDENIYSETIRKYIKNPITNEILKNVEKQEGQNIRVNRGKVDYNSLKDATYILSILKNFKSNDNDEGTENIASLILNKFSEIKEGKGEEVAFYYGFNKGYRIFKKEYNNIEYKFKLNSLLDYYTIESVFQRTINGSKEKCKAFDYMDWCPNKSNEIKTTKLSNSDYIVLDTVVIGKKKEKVGSEKYCKESFQWFFGKIKTIFLDLIEGKTLPNMVQNLWNDIIIKIGDDKETEFEDRLNSEKMLFEQKIQTIQLSSQNKCEKTTDNLNVINYEDMLKKKDEEIEKLKNQLNDLKLTKPMKDKTSKAIKETAKTGEIGFQEFEK